MSTFSPGTGSINGDGEGGSTRGGVSSFGEHAAMGQGKKEYDTLWAILEKYQEVFNNDISKGYNNASGEFDVDWNWSNDQQPPPGVSKQEVYSNEELNQLKQEKIDWMDSQNICFKAHLLILFHRAISFNIALWKTVTTDP